MNTTSFCSRCTTLPETPPRPCDIDQAGQFLREGLPVPERYLLWLDLELQTAQVLLQARR